MTDLKSTFTIDSAIAEFYKLKEKYRSKYYEKFVEPIVKSDVISSKHKRIAFAKLPKAECINCQRQVGSIFTIRNDADTNNKIFKATCGDLTEPCPMNIHIEYASRYTFSSSIESERDNVNSYNMKIIKGKNNLMFFDEDPDAESIRKFDELSQEASDAVEMLGYYNEENIDTNHNPVKKQLLRTEIANFHINFILPFKAYIKQFEETNNGQHIKEAIQFYVKEMMPKIQEIQKLKYNSMYIEFDKNEGTYNLIQKTMTIASNEYSILEDTIISFVMGIADNQSQNKINLDASFNDDNSVGDDNSVEE